MADPRTSYSDDAAQLLPQRGGVIRTMKRRSAGVTVGLTLTTSKRVMVLTPREVQDLMEMCEHTLAAPDPEVQS